MMRYTLKEGLLGLGCLTFLSACGSQKATEVVEKTANNTYKTVDLSYINPVIQPQEDFFLFANGTWVKNNPVPPSESRWGSFNELDEDNKRKLMAILQDAKERPGEKGSQTQILGDYFASYIDFDTRNSLGIEPIQEELGWVEQLTKKEDIPQLIGKLHTNGIRALFGFGVGQDLKNVEKHISSFRQGGLGLPNRDYYMEDSKSEILNKYQAHVGQMFEMLGLNDRDPNQVAEDAVAFEKALAVTMMRPAEMRIPEKTYNKMALAEFNSFLGNFDFQKYLSSTGSQSFDTLIVGQPDFARGLAKIYEVKSLDEWKNYLTWKVVNHYAGHLTEDIVNQNFVFYGTTLSGKIEMKQAEERCIDEITNLNFGEWLGRAFVERHFSKEASQRINVMVDNLLAVYKERINGLTWMTAETKKEALKKLNSIGRKLGHPEEWEDYSSLDFNAKTYVHNYRNTLQFAHKKNMAKLNEPVDKKEWGMPAHMVNAYYHPLLNEIAFPAGIMQPPFFDVLSEDAVNYGRIGMVIGHEFTHGFDDMGSKFAADGSFTNWWTEQDRAAFEEKTKTLGETYSSFCPVEDHCVNPDLTMGENIADLGGLTMAYYAYKRTVEYKSGIVRNGYTPDQRFFIAYAQLWKINYTEAELKNRISNDPHSPGMYRVNGPLMNCPEFFEAFSVKEGDKMRNSKDKVARIW